MLTRSYGTFRRPRTALAFLLLIGGFVSPFSSTGSALAASQTLVFAAGAYGAYASVGTKVVVGTTAGIGLGCGTTSGVSKSASALSVTHPPLVTTGTVNDDVSTTTNSSEASADVQDLSIIGGAITATDVQAVSVTTLSQSVFEVSSAGSRFMGLVIAGKSISSNVPANTSIPLAGLGKVVLNEQNTVVGASAAKLTVNMIHVYVTMANSLGIANGTQIIVADASSGLTLANGPGVLGGVAYGTLVRESVLQSATAPVSLGCFGTNGKTITNTLGSVNQPGILSSGTVTDTAKGSITPSETSGDTTSTVDSLNLLEGVVGAGTLTVQANASTSDGVHVHLSDTGTSFTNLMVSGHPEITDDVPPNTKVALSGVGTVCLRCEATGSNYIDVKGIQLLIGQNNIVGLPAGTLIIVGHASALIHTSSSLP